MNVKDFSKICASPKRLAILKIIYDETFVGYNQLRSTLLRKYKIIIGSSEIYKHIKLLRKYKLIERKGTQYISTSNGENFMFIIEKLVDFGGEVIGKGRKIDKEIRETND